MSLLTLLDAQLAHGHWPLLDHAEFALEAGERVALIGRNGTGKSSMLRVLAGHAALDGGVLHCQQGIRVALVAQEPVLDPDATVFLAVSEGLALAKSLRDQYSALASSGSPPQAVHGASDTSTDALGMLHAQIDAIDGWTWEQRVQESLQRLRLEGGARVGELSGGQRKRVALAQALVSRPDVLLLDEPTNHLDLESIVWLEDLLLGLGGSLVFVTHDRAFLDRVATRVVELDRGHLASYPGNFSRYRVLKAEQMAAEAVVQAKADKLLAQEEIWIRKGVEARRTRAQARIVRLQALRASHAARRAATGRVQLDVDTGSASGRLVAELTGVSKSFDAPAGPRAVVRDLDTIVLRGDKIGLMGPNGAGKTTLLRLILGELAPDAGQVKLGTKLQVAYFDQMRDALDPEAALEDFISPGSEWIEIGNRRQHVRSYLGDFLFAPERARSPVRSLSGGERNRLLLARLFARPANVLVLDEPTNDLDIDTLELLEDLLVSYEGTVFLVSHDRAFLNAVVTSTLVAQGDGRWREYEGSVDDWLSQSRREQALTSTASLGGQRVGDRAGMTTGAAPTNPPSDALSSQISPERSPNGATLLSKKKLSYKEQRELETLPALMSQLTAEQAAIDQQLADDAIYQRDPQGAAQLHARHTAIDDELLAAMEREEALKARAG